VIDRCNTDANGSTRLFKVQKVWDPGIPDYDYAIYDCGTSGWLTCSLLDMGPPLGGFQGAVFGLVDAEVNFGQSACTNRVMGSSSDSDKFGGASDPIEGQHNVGDAWSVQTLTYGAATCSNYASGTHTNDTFKEYDDRNTS